MEQREALGTRLVGALTLALILFLVMAVVTPVLAEISSVSPGSGTVTAGDTFSLTVNLTGDDTCLGATASSGLIGVAVTPACHSGAGPWTASVSLTPDYDTPAGTYTITLTETPQVEGGGSADVATFTLTVNAAPPTTTTTTLLEGTTTTTDPTAPPTTEPPTTTTTSPPATTTTAPTTTTTVPEETTTTVPPGPTTTIGSTTTQPVTTSPPPTIVPDTSPPATEPEDHSFFAAPAPGGANPPPAAAVIPEPVDQGGAIERTTGSIAVAIDALDYPTAVQAPVSALTLRGLAEAIPQSLIDLVVSPFVIIGVIFGAIRDTGAATVWPLLVVLPLMVDWRALRERLTGNRTAGAS